MEHAGIVNILAKRLVVPEYLQNEVESKRLAAWVEGQLEDAAGREKLSQELLAVAAELGDGGVHERVALAVEELLEK